MSSYGMDHLPCVSNACLAGVPPLTEWFKSPPQPWEWAGGPLSALAQLSEYQVFCLTFPLLCIGYTLSVTPFMVLERVKHPFFEKFRVNEGVYHSGKAKRRCLWGVAHAFLGQVLPMQILSYPLFRVFGTRADIPLPPLWLGAIQLAMFFVVEDYLNYWLHRWLHTPWAYNAIHRLHHEYSLTVSLAASYAHWAEIIILGIPSFVGPAVCGGCHVLLLWAWILLRQLEAVDTHSGYDFPWDPTKLVPGYVGPEFHDYHHFAYSGNFASIFRWCDAVYGTDSGYRAWHAKGGSGPRGRPLDINSLAGVSKPQKMK